MTSTAITAADRRNHRRAVRFFWALLIASTTVSLAGNITHAVLPYLPRLAVQVGAAAVPPIALLAAVHGIALAVRAGASNTAYRWAIGAVTVIGAGAFALSFIALNDLMQTLGYSPTTAWMFPAIIDTAVAVSTVMLVALGDKPARRTRTAANTRPAPGQHNPKNRPGDAKPQHNPTSTTPPVQARHVESAQTRAPLQTAPIRTAQALIHTPATPADADLAAELIATGATTQPLETILTVLATHRAGASINAAAKTAGINYRTAQRIIEGAAKHHRRLAAAS